MAYSPGELLVRAGALTAAQLRTAVDRREKEGGSLGESLVALGLIDEEKLAQLYSRRLVLPRIEDARLEGIDRDVLALVPPELAAEFRIVPLSVDGEGSLTVAMADPSDNHAVEEVAFFVDKFILRGVATESAVRRAIHRYYGLLAPAKKPDFELPIDVDHETLTPVLPPRVATPPEPKPSPIVVLTKKKELSEPEPDEPVLLTKKRSPHPVTMSGVSGGSVVPTVLAPIQPLRDAVDRDVVARHLLDFAAQVAGRAALFVTRQGALTGFDVRGDGLDRGRLELLQIPLSRPSLFEAVVKSRLPYRGLLPDTPQDKVLGRALGAREGDEVLVWPILVRDRVVATLYADRLKPDLPEAALQATLYEAGRAYERILLAQKARP